MLHWTQAVRMFMRVHRCIDCMGARDLSESCDIANRRRVAASNAYQRTDARRSDERSM
jgi:hypothetical protein